MHNKIFNYSDLKEYCKHLIKGGSDLVYQAHLRAKEKVKEPSLLAEIESLKSRIAELRSQLSAQRREESEAGRKALDLYWENTALQPYKEHAEGVLFNWVPKTEHRNLQDSYDRMKLEFATVSSSKLAMEREWAEFVNNYDVESMKTGG